MNEPAAYYCCEVPAVPPSLNEFRHWCWQKQERERKAFQQLVWAVLNEKGNRCPRGLERITVKAILTFKVYRGRDSDNFGAVLAKWVQDVLVKEGVIPDDTADRCTFEPPALIVGEHSHTFLVIEEVQQ